MNDSVEIDYAGSVAIVRLADPATRNALTVAMVDALRECFEEVEESARAMILTGKGKNFCSGANLRGGLQPKPADHPLIDCGQPLETHINPLMAKLRGFRIPWISAVEGAAAGAGASLALAGDMVVVGDSARFVFAFSHRGLVPDAGATHMLVRTIGRVRANEVMMFGDSISAQEAQALGLVNKVVPDLAVASEALALARRLADGPACLTAIRRLSWQALDTGFEAMAQAEREAQFAAGRTADFREGVEAFLGKRAAQFKGK